jgi:hypothetical protein
MSYLFVCQGPANPGWVDIDPTRCDMADRARFQWVQFAFAGCDEHQFVDARIAPVS